MKLMSLMASRRAAGRWLYARRAVSGQSKVPMQSTLHLPVVRVEQAVKNGRHRVWCDRCANGLQFGAGLGGCVPVSELVQRRQQGLPEFLGYTRGLCRGTDHSWRDRNGGLSSNTIRFRTRPCSHLVCKRRCREFVGWSERGGGGRDTAAAALNRGE